MIEKEIKMISNGFGTDTSIIVSQAYNKEVIEGVQLGLESSTSRARVFNLSLQMATLNWQDPILNRIEEMLEKRLLSVANGKYFIAKCEVILTGRKWTWGITALDKKEVIELFTDAYPDSKILTIQEQKQ